MSQGKRVLVVDDVITAGTAIREAFDILTEAGATLAGVVIALDRQVCGWLLAAAASWLRAVFSPHLMSCRRQSFLSSVVPHASGVVSSA